MAKTYRTIIQNETESSFELDLSPMLSLMVALIPIMLLATVFVRVTVIETPLPQVVQQAIEKDRKNKDNKPSVQVDMNQKFGFRVRVVLSGKELMVKSIPRSQEGWNYALLHAELLKVKQTHPDVFRIEMSPSSAVAYEEIVKAIDEARRSREGEPRFSVEGDGGQKAETELMFPEVYFANVVEG